MDTHCVVFMEPPSFALIAALTENGAFEHFVVMDGNTCGISNSKSASS